jgi:hypothetical protein
MQVWFRHKDRVALFLGLSSLVPFLYFLYVGLKREVGIHWPAAGWTGAVVFMAGYLAAERPANKRVTVRVFFGTVAIAVCVLFTLALNVAACMKPSTIALRWSYWGDPERINTDKLNEIYGWPELGRWVHKVQEEMVSKEGETTEDVFVFTGQYGLSAAISFYTPDQIRTHLWSPKRVHGENYRFWDNYALFKGKNGIFVTKDADQATAALPGLRGHFTVVGEPERLPVYADGKEVRSFYLVRCYVFDGMEPQFDKDGENDIKPVITVSPPDEKSGVSDVDRDANAKPRGDK